MSVETPEGRKVLVQDLPQYEASVQKARVERAQKEQKEYDAAVKQYEKDEKAAEAQYQKDLVEYNRQLAEAERIEKERGKYDAQIQKLEAEKQRELSDAHYSVWGPGGSRNRSELKSKESSIIKNYDSKINQAIESKRIQTGYEEFSLAYPGQALPRNVAETFRSSPSFSLVGLYEKKVEGKAVQAERKRQASAQSAQNISERMSAEYHGGISNIGFISSGLGTQRGSDVKPLPDAPTGKKAVETRRPLINVKTVETIYGGQQIETNPRAFVASLTRQDVDAAGRPLKPKPVEQPIINIVTPTPEPIQNKDRWQVEVNGKIRTFKTKESAEEFIQRITPRQTFGPVFQKQESVYLPAGSLEYLLSTKQLKQTKQIQSDIPLGPEKPRPLESAIQFFGDIGKQYKDIQPIAFTTGAIEEGLGIIGGTINLIEKGKQKLGEFTIVKYPIKEVKKPYTLPSSPFEYPLDVGYEAVFQGTPITQAEKQAREKQIQIIKDEGGFRYSGKLAVTLATIPFRGIARTGEKAVSSLLKPTKKEASSFLQRRTASMLDVRTAPSKPFSYDIPYTPSKRANEIDISDFGERIGPATPISKKPVAARQSDVILPKPEKIVSVKEDIAYKPRGRYEGGFKDIFASDKGEIVGPSTPLSQKPVAARQSDVRLFVGEKPQPVKLDPFMKTAPKKPNIDFSRDNAAPIFSETRIRLGRGEVIKPKYTKPIETIREEKGYRPRGRYEGGFKDIFASDTKIPKELFTSTRISLGKSQLKTPKMILKGKQPKPVELEKGYKPSKKTDFSLDTKLTEFKSDEFKMGGSGTEVKSGGQILIQVKKSEELTKKKLLTKRQTPVNVNWSEQIQTSNIPKTGGSPIQILVPREKEKKKKPYLQTSIAMLQTFDVPLSAQRPKIKAAQKIGSVQEFKLSSPQRESLKFETIPLQRISQKPKTIQKTQTRQLRISKYETVPIQRVSPRLAQTPKLASPLLPKAPAKLKAPQRQPLREKPVQISILRTRPPRTPKVIFALPPQKDPEKTKEKKSKPGSRADFFGNVPEESVTGMFGKRQTITYGQSRIEKVRKGDVRVLSGKPRTERRSKKQEDLLGFKKGKKTKFF